MEKICDPPASSLSNSPECFKLRSLGACLPNPNLQNAGGPFSVVGWGLFIEC